MTAHRVVDPEAVPSRWVVTIFRVEIPSGKVRAGFDLPEGRGEGMSLMTPDGKGLAVCSLYETAALHDLVTGKELAVLRGPERMPQRGKPLPNDPGAWTDACANVAAHLAMSRDGKWLAVSTQRGYLQVWDLVRKKRLWRQQLSQHLRELDFSPDGSRLLTRHIAEPFLTIWETRTGHQATAFSPRNGVAHARWRPDGESLLLAVPHLFPGLLIWQYEGGRYLGQQDNVELPRFSSIRLGNDPFVLSADCSVMVDVSPLKVSEVQKIRVWDLKWLLRPRAKVRESPR